MITLVRASASGLDAQQMNVDIIANNIANVNTTAFKASRADFKDLLYTRQSRVGEFEGAPSLDGPDNVWHGSGVRTASTQRLMDQGTIKQSDEPLHMAIHGEGFFTVQLPDGSAAFTRDGSFTLDKDGRLVTVDGNYVMPNVAIPGEVTNLSVNDDGTIIYGEVGEDNRIVRVGGIQLAKFSNPIGLEAIGDNLYRATVASGPGEIDYPGENGRGSVVGYSLEVSNVNLTTEMTNLVRAQRAYQLNARALQTIDEMLGLANNFRR